jgi:phage shock protein PspC (stress-responsive transcriptional regulator)
MNKFKRVSGHEWLGGVCGGIAYSLGIPTWIVRMAVVVFVLSFGVGIVPYVLLWIFVPSWENDPRDYNEVTSS